MPKFIDFLVKPTQFSNYDLSNTKRFSASDGLFYPVNWYVMNPGETFRINMRSLIRTNPTLGPTMGRFKVRFVTVVSNIKNYCVGLEGYRRSFDWRTFRLPTFYWPVLGTQASALAQGALRFNLVRETTLMDYLGFERGYCPTKQQYNTDDPAYADRVDNRDIYPYGSAHETFDCLRFNALPLLVYWDVYRNYMVNPQFPYYPKVIARHVNGSDNYADSFIEMLPIADLDTMFETIHKYYDGKTDGTIQDAVGVANFDRMFKYRPTLANISADGGVSDICAFHGGLASTLFDPDINTNFLSKENYERLSEVKINTMSNSTTDEHISFGDIVKASRLWDFITREIYGGGTYADHIYNQFGVSVRGDMNIPQVVHVYDSMVDFEDITSQSNTANDSANADYAGSVVGEQYGVGRGYGQSPKFVVKNIDNNYALLATYMWITPMVDYATGISEEFGKTNMSDLYSPAFDNYSMQPRFQEQMNASVVGADGTSIVANRIDPFSADAYLYDSTIETQARVVLGYQPAWAEYKTNLNRVHGLFVNGLSYWTIVRKMRRFYGVTQPDIYVWQATAGTQALMKDSHGIEVPFSVQNEDNFFVQVRMDVTATRPISKSMVPHVK